MASTAWPAVVAAVMTVAERVVTPAIVVRGRDTSDEPGDVVMVGLLDPEQTGWVSAGTFQQTMQTFGGNREEVGSVNGLAVAWNGDGDQDAACSTAFAYLASIEGAVRADPTLGLTAFDYVVAELQAGDVMEAQSDLGAGAALSFTIAYKIRI